jgi:hypothetical protein
MAIRLFDRFDRNFTVATFTGVDWIDSDGTIFFEDGDTYQYDREFVDWEEAAT